MEDRLYDFWASCLQNGYIGNLIDIVERAGGARELYHMKHEHIAAALGVSDKMADLIAADRDDDSVEYQYEKMSKHKITYVNYMDDIYPTRLKYIASRPHGLFVKGNLPNENTAGVAIVGARACSEYGRTVAEYMAGRLAESGINTISGMAWGIDGIAQMATVKKHGRSYAVLGCGVDIAYPRNNKALYDMLVTDGNGVISEYAPGTEPNSRLFPPRNRIISGLSDLLLVIEARVRSGTLITAGLAIEQGKTVMAVPGRITDPLSAGCIKLIAEGAYPVSNFESVLNEINCYNPNSDSDNANEGYEQLTLDPLMTERVNSNRACPLADMSEEEQSVYTVLGLDPCHVDDIAEQVEMDISAVLAILTGLELKGRVRETGNGFFVRSICAIV